MDTDMADLFRGSIVNGKKAKVEGKSHFELISVVFFCLWNFEIGYAVINM